MKKNISLLLGLAFCLAVLAAAGGGDPLISRSYLEGDFSRTLETMVNSRLDTSDAAIRSGRPLTAGEAAAPGAQELMLKEGDVLSCQTGVSATLLSGEARSADGALVDVTAGAEIPAGQQLQTGHRYIAAESAAFTVASPTAVLLCEGGGTLTASLSPDYFAVSRALRSLRLFQGSGSGFGEGFDLHLAPTRGEGLVMFLRILGEEQQALACTGSHPFTDVPAWLDRYVAWAYAQGYANGVSPDQFGCEMRLSSVEYEEFLLRALGYSVAGVDDYNTSLERALTCGALTAGEFAMLRNEPFLRAQVAYISYYTLDMPVSGGSQTLAQRLIGAGVMTEDQLASAKAQVTSLRLE